MKARVVVLLAFLALPDAGHAKDLPDRLRCELTGSGSCPHDGICIGGSVRNSGVRLTLMPGERPIRLNGIRGHIPDDEKAIGISASHYINWDWGIVGLDEMRISEREGNSYLLVLNGPSQALDKNEAEFTCVGD